MQKNLTLRDIEEINQTGKGNANKSSFELSHLSLFDLKLVTKKIPLKYCEYKISNLPEKMLSAESIAISPKGVLFCSSFEFKKGALLRVWVEIPDYWSRKSRMVEYRHTEAPTYFQILCRMLSVEENIKKFLKFQILSEILSLDPVDEAVLEDYLHNSGVFRT
jgi:hypothetical protein